MATSSPAASICWEPSRPWRSLGGPGGLLVSALIRGNSFTTSTLNKPILKALFERKPPADASRHPRGDDVTPPNASRRYPRWIAPLHTRSGVFHWG